MINKLIRGNSNVHKHVFHTLRDQIPPIIATHLPNKIFQPTIIDTNCLQQEIRQNKIKKQVINELIRGNSNVHKHVFRTLRDQIPPITTTHLPNKIFQPTIIDINAGLNTSL